MSYILKQLAAADGYVANTPIAPFTSQWMDVAPLEADGSYTRRNSYAQLYLTTSATSIEIQTYSSFAAALGGAATVPVSVNGVTQIININASVPTWYPITVSTGVKNITLFSGENVRPGGSGGIVGTNILAIRANKSFNIQSKPLPTNRYTLVADSIGNTKWATDLMRNYLQDSSIGRLTSLAISADSLTEQGSNSGLRTVLIAKIGATLNGTSTNNLIFALGTNDAGLSKCTAAQFGTYFSAFIDAFHTAYPSCNVFVFTPTPVTTGYESTLETFRAQERTIASTRPWINLTEGNLLITNAATQLVDGLHPNTTTGAAAYFAGAKTALGI